MDPELFPNSLSIVSLHVFLQVTFHEIFLQNFDFSFIAAAPQNK
jgi:hypothetical protein